MLDRETERQRDRETERQSDRETERQSDRQTESERIDWWAQVGNYPQTAHFPNAN